MLFPSLSLLVGLGLYSAALAQQHPDIKRRTVVHIPTPAIDERGLFSSIGICESLSCPTTSSSTIETTSSSISSSIKSTSRSAISTSSSSSTKSTSSSGPTSTSTMTGTPTYNNMVITTVFTQPPECTTGGITEMAYWGTDLWENNIFPVADATITSCFPSQFYSSLIATASGVSLPAFSALVCPYEWETYYINTTYIICCPSGFGLYAPNGPNADRPGLGAICTSDVWPSVLMDITSYDSTALATVIPTSAPDSGTLVFANAFDGIAVSPSTAPPSSTSTAFSSAGASSVTTTSSSSAKASSTSSKASSSVTTTSSSSAKASSTSSKASSSVTTTSSSITYSLFVLVFLFNVDVYL